MHPSDSECDNIGIPPHLHRSGREIDDSFEEDNELLYRRISAKDEMTDLTTVINFRRMSVNRAKYCENPRDVLWNDEEGGTHDGFGVVSFPVGALKDSWEHPDPKHSYAFTLKPTHAPTRCNYSHSEIVAYKINENGSIEILSDIKPSSIKLRIREHIRRFLKLSVPGT